MSLSQKCPWWENGEQDSSLPVSGSLTELVLDASLFFLGEEVYLTITQ